MATKGTGARSVGLRPLAHHCPLQIKPMTTEHPITPPPELVKQWDKECDSRNNSEINSTFDALQHFASKAARWGADQQLEQDAKWLDTNALFSRNLTISPSGDALRKEMRPKPPSLKEQALASVKRLEENGEFFSDQMRELAFIRKALEALPND